jgi:hypothetical protein
VSIEREVQDGERKKTHLEALVTPRQDAIQCVDDSALLGLARGVGVHQAAHHHARVAGQDVRHLVEDGPKAAYSDIHQAKAFNILRFY